MIEIIDAVEMPMDIGFLERNRLSSLKFRLTAPADYGSPRRFLRELV
jgi:hypothetical protein